MQTLSDLPLPPGVSADPNVLEKEAQKLMAKVGDAPIQEQPEAPEPVQQEVLADSQPDSEITSTEPEPAPEDSKSKQAKNFKDLKAQMMRLQKEKELMARQLQQVQEQTRKAQDVRETPVQAEVPDNELEFRDDEYIEAKHVNLLAKQLKDVKNQLKQFQSQNTVTLAEQRLRIEFPDFQKVFTQENCQTLAMLDPDLAASIDADSDPYRKAKLAYKSIKNMGIDNTDEYNEDKERIQKNMAKPRSSATVAATSPLSKAMSFEKGLTKELQNQLLAEMAAARKGY